MIASSPSTSADLRAVFTFPFQGERWRERFVVGSGLLLLGFIVPVLPVVLVYGQMIAVMRAAIEGRALVLPAWDDWGELAGDGLRALAIGLVFLLPGTLIFFGGFSLYFGTSLALPLMTTGAEEAGPLTPLLPLFFIGVILVLFLTMSLGSLVSIVGAVPLPMAAAHFVAQDELSAAFRVREWWPLLRSDRLGYFIAWVVLAGLIAILYLLLMLAYYTLVLCCLIPFVGAPVGYYLSVVSAALFGQTYRQSTQVHTAGQPPK